MTETLAVRPAAFELRGIFPILAMPFTRHGSVDEECLAAEVDWAIDAGVDGLGLALASELPRLTESERERVIRIAVSESHGRVPIVVGASAESALVASSLIAHAEEHGAAAVMIHPPLHDVSSPRSQRAFFDEILQRTPLPMFLQDLPYARLDLSVLSALERDHPGQILVKAENPPTSESVVSAISATDGRVPVFGGAGGLLFYSELLRGAVGTMPGCVFPEAFVAIWRHFSAGDFTAARTVFARIVPFLNATNRPGLMLSFYREALVQRGIFREASTRNPGVELETIDRRELRELLEDIRHIAYQSSTTA